MAGLKVRMTLPVLSCLAVLCLGLSRGEEDLIGELMIRYEVPEREVEPVVRSMKGIGMLEEWMRVINDPKPALIIVDMQNDFISGSLKTKGAIDLIPKVQEMLTDPIWRKIVFTQDWHPQDHISFFSNYQKRALEQSWLDTHPGNISVFEEVVFAGPPPYSQILWPDHCVQGTEGSEIHPDLEVPTDAIIIKKGTNPEMDSYSGFFDNSGTSGGDTGLAGQLKGYVTEVVVVGVATDYCVGSTTIDAQHVGLAATLLEDVARGVSEDTTEKMLTQVGLAGGRVTTWEEWRLGLDGWARAKQIADRMLVSSHGTRTITSPLLLLILPVLSVIYQ